MNQRGAVQVEAIICFLPFFAAALLVGFALWRGLGARIHDYDNFLEARAKLVQKKRY